eukprot:5420743-Pyramimonas_sp.AAC.1
MWMPSRCKQYLARSAPSEIRRRHLCRWLRLDPEARAEAEGSGTPQVSPRGAHPRGVGSGEEASPEER